MLRLGRVTPATLDVLRELVAGTEPVWGLQLVGRTTRPAGSVYPILARLEEGGWVVSRWADDPVRGPRRRLYELTEEGRVSAFDLLAGRSERPRRARRSSVEPEAGLA